MLVLNAASGLRRGPHHPHGQQPVEHQHHHYKPRGDDPLTSNVELLHDAKHIEEDTKVLTAEALAKMSPEELEFYYFSAHDFDRNNKLDGLELLKAVYHTMDHEDDEESQHENSVESNVLNDMENYIILVDRTLASDDTDGDGFISYAEYRSARAADNSKRRTSRVLRDDPPPPPPS